MSFTFCKPVFFGASSYTLASTLVEELKAGAAARATMSNHFATSDILGQSGFYQQ